MSPHEIAVAHDVLWALFGIVAAPIVFAVVMRWFDFVFDRFGPRP